MTSSVGRPQLHRLSKSLKCFTYRVVTFMRPCVCISIIYFQSPIIFWNKQNNWIFAKNICFAKSNIAYENIQKNVINLSKFLDSSNFYIKVCKNGLHHHCPHTNLRTPVLLFTIFLLTLQHSHRLSWKCGNFFVESDMPCQSHCTILHFIKLRLFSTHF